MTRRIKLLGITWLCAIGLVGASYWAIRAYDSVGRVRTTSEERVTRKPGDRALTARASASGNETRGVPAPFATAPSDSATISDARAALYQATTLKALLTAAGNLSVSDADVRWSITAASQLCLGNWHPDPTASYAQSVARGYAPDTEAAKSDYLLWSGWRSQFCGDASSVAQLATLADTVARHDRDPPDDVFNRLLTAIDLVEQASAPQATASDASGLDVEAVTALQRVLETTPSRERFLLASDRLLRFKQGPFAADGDFARVPERERLLQHSLAAELAACNWSHACGPSSLVMLSLCRDRD